MLQSPDHAPAQDETERLQALHRLDILDSDPEPAFDEVVRVATEICGTPAAFVNLLDRDRQWFKAKLGVDADSLPREGAICDALVGMKDLLVVPDTMADPRFRTNRFVQGDPAIRFYAGMPLNTTDGFTVGTLCVTDQVPRQLDSGQQEALRALGRQVATQMELRSKVRELHERMAERDRAERKLRERTVLFSAFMEHSPAIGFIKDVEGRFLYYNKAFCERFAVSPTEWIDKSVFDLFPREFAAAYHDDDLAVMTSGISKVIEETSPGPDGTILYWRSHKFLVQTEDGTPLLGGLCMDVSSEQETVLRLRALHADLVTANQELAELSVTDALTGLSNRRAFDERLAKEVERGGNAALILIDLDHFKALNDTYGHLFGDGVLRTTAQLLKSACRGRDCVSRFGGEEFAILLADADAHRALDAAERLRQSVEQHAWKERGVTASLGITLCSTNKAPAEIIAEADFALYQAKASGRNCVRWFDPQILS